MSVYQTTEGAVHTRDVAIRWAVSYVRAIQDSKETDSSAQVTLIKIVADRFLKAVDIILV